jgi:phage replication O-like protein O
MATAHQAMFPGFQFPNTTQIPNEVFDTLMPHLSGGELKVLLYICRRTFGFRKDSDSISLTQISKGITTKAGKVLDQGTGLSRRQVQRALRVLENRKVIEVTRKIDETGLNEINTYRLNVRGSDKMSPGVGTSMSLGVETPVSGGVETPVSITKQREQKKERQNKDVVVAVAKDLENFGIAQSAATKLIQSYPAAYIREKLEMAKGLVAAGSCLVSQNPAGWLRRAIEENYSPPKTSQRHRQRSVREKQAAKLVPAEPREQHLAEEEPQQVQNVPTEPTETNTEKKEPENINRAESDAARENEAIWHKALEHLQADLPLGEAETRLQGTTLVELTATTARILVPSTHALLWLERRLYREITNAMKGVLGKDLDLQFVTAS